MSDVHDSPKDIQSTELNIGATITGFVIIVRADYVYMFLDILDFIKQAAADGKNGEEIKEQVDFEGTFDLVGLKSVKRGVEEQLDNDYGDAQILSSICD